MPRLILLLVVVVALIYVARRLFSPRAIFRIQVGDKRTVLTGQVPGYSSSDIKQFIAELRLPSGAIITGVPDGDRYRLKFNGAVPPSARQRIRNYFFLKL